MKQIKIFVLAIFTFLFCQEGKTNDEDFVLILKDYVQSHYKKFGINDFIFVSIKSQNIYYINDTLPILKFRISTSKFGFGNELNSEKTPIGLHRVSKKIGEGAPIGGILDKNGYTGNSTTITTEKINTNKDHVTTRAMKLTGLEPGLNQGGKIDSDIRDIYIHGTHEEGWIGEPASHGCVRMKNLDVITLFNQVKLNTYVLILNK